MQGVLRALALLACAVTLAACVTPRAQRPLTPLDPAEEVRFLQGLPGFELSGRLAVAANGEGLNAQLGLEQRGESTTLQLRSPLGLGSLRVEAGPRELRVSTSRGERIAGEGAREILRQRLGFDPPLESLRYWVLGVPDPNGDVLIPSEGPDASPRNFTQGNWKIETQELRAQTSDGKTLEVPRRLSISTTNVRVRLVLEKWILRP